METTDTSTRAAEINRLQSLEKELKARLRQQAAISELGQLALTSSLQNLMERLAEMMVEILEVEYCKILELLPDGKELLLRAGAGWKPGYVGKLRISAGTESQAGYTLLSQGPVIVTDLKTEKRFTSPPLLVEHGIVSGMGVIVPGKKRPFGVLSVHTTQARQFTTDDITFLHSAAGLLASAVERGRVEEELLSSRNQLAVILESVADGITVQDRFGNLVYANEPAAHLSGFDTAEEMVNRPLSEIIEKIEILDEDGRPIRLDQLPGMQVLQGKPQASATLRYRLLPSGDNRWSMIKARPVFNAAGEAELAVNIFQDITGLKRAEMTQRLLAEVGEVLNASLDYTSSLQAVAQLCVPHLADWCAVHLVEDGENVLQVAVAHADPGKVELARRANQDYPPDLSAPNGVGKVLRTGKPEYYPKIDEAILAGSAMDGEQLRLLKALGPRSMIIVPLVARGRTLGALTLIWAESGHRYSQDDVNLATELARRAALVIDNLRLYREAQELNTRLEGRVAERTKQLQATVTRLLTEIGERKKAEEAARESEKMLSSLFESAPDALILVGGSGEILRANAQAEKMFGYSREELLALKIDNLLPQGARVAHAIHRFNFMTEGRARSMGAGLDLFGIRKDGTEFPIDIMLSPIETPEGLLVISAVRDITERKRIEAELAEVQRRLIESVEAERLRLSQDLHDGPIQELYGLTYQLKFLDDRLDEFEELKQELYTAEEGMQGVISTLREICNELRPPALAAFGLDKAIESHLERLRAQQPGLAIHMRLQPCQDSLTERQQLALYRIYQSAVSNVLRHSGATQLDVSLLCEHGRVNLEIRDNGCGFEVPDRWIELARRGHLGLVGTAERVQSIGGKLNIISAPGKGTTIQVSLPPVGSPETKG